MKATYNKAALAARGVLQQTARNNGVSYEEVYEGFKNTIRYGLASTDPESVEFWNGVKCQAGKEVPSPEDLLIYVSAMSHRMPDTSYRKLCFAEPVFH